MNELDDHPFWLVESALDAYQAELYANQQSNAKIKQEGMLNKLKQKFGKN